MAKSVRKHKEQNKQHKKLDKIDVIVVKAVKPASKQYSKALKNNKKIAELVEHAKNKNKTIVVFTTLQDEAIAKIVYSFVAQHCSAIYAGTVLGCQSFNIIYTAIKKSKLRFDDCIFLFVGSGTFHIKMFVDALLNYTARKQKQFTLPKLHVYSIQASLQALGKITLQHHNDIAKQLLKQKKAKFVRFVYATNIGLIISVKPGQFMLQNMQLDRVLRALQRLQRINKKVYFFLADNITEAELINFGLDFYVALACPGVNLDYANLANLDELLLFLHLLEIDKLKNKKAKFKTKKIKTRIGNCKQVNKQNCKQKSKTK